MDGLSYTDIPTAKELVQQGRASPQDFLTVSGSVSWYTQELECEMQQEHWYHASSFDSALLRATLKDESPWNSLLNFMGTNASKLKSHKFDNRMLEAWAERKLVFDGGLPPFLDETASEQHHEPLRAGDMLIASSSSFLFRNQEFHKSILLVIEDDQDQTVAAFLNYPTSKSVESMGAVRYGGKTESPTFVLHRHDTTGIPIGLHDRIHKSTLEEAQEAMYMVVPGDSLVVSGVEVFDKDENGVSSLEGHFHEDHFERVSPENLDEVWNLLVEQRAANEAMLEVNLQYALMAWNVAHGLEASSLLESSDTTELGLEVLRMWMRTNCLSADLHP